MMFDKRLFSLADGVGRLIAAKVACQWLGLVANIAFVVAVVRMLQPLFAPVPSATAPCIAIILIAAVVRFVTIRAAARFGSEAAERVKLALREKLFNKMLALGPSYAQRVRTAGVVQSAGEGIEQIQSFFELFLPQLCYAVLAPITLFAVLAPIDLPTAATLLACAPLIVLIVGMVAMRAARVFKKYWGKYTDMGAAFLDNLQGLETLKTFDADERAARVMDEKAEQFRVMTMNVLQIQLRSLTAMDAVAYGGAAAGIGVAIWRFVSGSLSPSGVFALSGVLPLGLTPIAAVLLTILLAADFFIPLRQLGSYFHVAMNGMTSTKRIFALLDAPEPEHGSKELPEFGASGRGVGVEFRGVSYRYADADVDAGGAAGAGPDAAGSAGAGVASPRRISSTSHSDMRNADVDSVDEGGGAGDARETRYALRNVALRALPGEVTAIVGPSGSGKSTAVQLLAGTLVGYEGDVLLSEMPSGMQDEVLGAMLSSAAPDDSETLKSHQIRDLTAASLTREISIVSAHSHLFAGTLRDNLLMARADATDNELWQTLEAAHIDDFVRAQSRGLDMPITQDGANLSGGQKQRIAIARVLLRRSAVYIFDEATSSVDADSETLILQTIRALADAGDADDFSVIDAIGGPRGVVESMLPGVVFVVMFVITSDLHLTIGVSAALAVLQVIVRLCQRQSVMGAVSGLLAVGICLIWAWNSHEARNYYMFGFLTNAFYIVLLAISLMVRVPGLGLVIEFIRTLPTEHLRAWLADWRGDKALNRAYTIITALWIGVFSLRLVVQVPLYLSNQVGWLGTARLLMGIPFWALAIWVSYLIVATPMHRHKTLAEPNADAMDDNNETEEQH